MNRIDHLRKIALNNQKDYAEFYYKFFKNYLNNQDKEIKTRYADALCVAFSALTPCIGDKELIVGRCENKMSPAESLEWENTLLQKAKELPSQSAGGQDSHMSIDYELVLSAGLDGIIKKINTYMEKCDKSKLTFYLACKKCLEAVINHAENYADTAAELAGKETDPIRRYELNNISKICRRVPRYPAESFYEAVQSVHFITYCLTLTPLRMIYDMQYQQGRPDRYLFKYYLKDIQTGAITKEFAQLLLNCFGIQMNMNVPNGLSNGYMVGGRDENGNIVANELTLMCMQVVDDIRLVYPAVGLCYTQGMPDTYIKKACEILSHGCSHPAIFNDDIISKGLQSYGVPQKDSHNYIHSTCVEITPIAASNVWVACPYTNMPQLLLDSLDREHSSLNQLLTVVFEKLDLKIKKDFECFEKARISRAENVVNPLLSCLVNDCLERGTDIEQGGARYNWTTPSFVGIGNLVDSLYAIKDLVFDKKELTISDFKEILDANFVGHEKLRQYILNDIPKYGNDIDEIDQYYVLITEHIINECKKHMGMYENSNLIPSVFCWIKHEQFGKNTGATPDGRLSGFPLGDGSGPCQGREMNGPTASILSSTKWKHEDFIGGVAVNMKFAKSTLGNNSIETMKNLIKTYMLRGGFEIQINVTDKETLEKAVENPEDYKDLIVRIGGYSDYFVKLSKGMQQEVILRTEHQI